MTRWEPVEHAMLAELRHEPQTVHELASDPVVAALARIAGQWPVATAQLLTDALFDRLLALQRAGLVTVEWGLWSVKH